MSAHRLRPGRRHPARKDRRTGPYRRAVCAARRPDRFPGDRRSPGRSGLLHVIAARRGGGPFEGTRTGQPDVARQAQALVRNLAEGVQLGIKGKIQNGVNYNGKNYGLVLVEDDRKFRNGR